MFVRQLFDRETSTYTYLVADSATHEAALIDPVIERVDRDVKLCKELGLSLKYVLETHLHADHVTGAGEIRSRTEARSVAGVSGARCADIHVVHGDRLGLGGLEIEVLATPGHTDDSVSYRIGDNVFTGDALLIRGTGRTDFQNGDAGQLFDSITGVLFALPDQTTVWPGHDYNGHSSSTIGEERRSNPRVAGKTRAQFIEILDNLHLPPPARIDDALPRNRACGATLHQDGPSPSVKDIDPPELRAMTGVRVIDVRELAEWNGELGHIEGATLVPLSTVMNAARDWDKRKPVVLVCRSGGRSMFAAQQLLAAGFEQIFNLRGGMSAYRAFEGR